ncbi:MULTISPECIES: ribbon-helix-helix protein, CopG family [Methylocaldum]|jgi:hypothetical protein|uniref:ribbon-helix-helix protein, CopG family n=1 Tax=unclassified Methylocaldum TaxID=2622260 RepID=UPI00098B1104|nr:MULTISPECIES: ribbon-helix-helix protein, CopG family [unclassified Methylocaldum]MBP1151057.1 metal-responsive CopG/Arc/MetJ family transcriptional regulator [Methylocaldum sp. RMAD-M]MVF24324.1 ribbon-helix-helix protein, CopG family [Methylocaldum sp. BRCS4]
MITVNLPNNLETRLDELAKKAGKTKEACAEEAIVEYVQQIEKKLGTTDTRRRKLLNFLNDLNRSPRKPRSAREIEETIQEERDAWD